MDRPMIEDEIELFLVMIREKDVVKIELIEGAINATIKDQSRTGSLLRKDAFWFFLLFLYGLVG